MEAINKGWIKLYRSCLDHWLYTEHRPLTRREAWETILLTVNYEQSKTLIKGKVYDCMPGQSLLSLDSWSKKFGWSIQKVRTFFLLLENDGMINTEGLQYTTRLTVCNWESYQGVATDQQQTDNRPTTDGQQTANRPITTIKEGKEVKEYKEDNRGKKATRFSPPSLDEILVYCQERKNNVDHERFFNFYTSKDWMVGKNKMKDWKAAVRNWEKPNNGKANNKTENTIIRNGKINSNDEGIFRGVEK